MYYSQELFLGGIFVGENQSLFLTIRKEIDAKPIGKKVPLASGEEAWFVNKVYGEVLIWMDQGLWYEVQLISLRMI